LYQYNLVQVKEQAVYALQHEYQIKKDGLQNGDQRGQSEIDIEYHISVDEDIELASECDAVIESVPQEDYKEISPDDSSNDDDFQLLSPKEEKILAQAKSELVRYRKKIAQQRAKKLADQRAKKKAVAQKKKLRKATPAKKGAVASKKSGTIKKADTKRVRIPTMAHVKRKNAKNAFFDWPIDLNKFWLSSVYGMRKHPRGGKRFHYGIDLAALRGTPVEASAAGVVIQAQYVAGYGNNIIVKHNNKYKTRYAHLHKIYVKKGQKVKQGQKIGAVGATGYVRKSGRDASHLHFEIYADGRHVNPLKYLLKE
jgi:murein DD-endopeptidase MepM/ murein hydrolase activator NlpD